MTKKKHMINQFRPFKHRKQYLLVCACSFLILQTLVLPSESLAQISLSDFFSGEKPICCGYFNEFTKIGWETENAFFDNLFSISDAEEMEYGANLLFGFKKENKILTSHEFKSEAESILKKITQNVERKEITYSIHIIEDDEINAFATLGGHVYLTTGIIRFVHSIDELAFIIGHEVAHIDKLHTQRKFKKIIFTHKAFEIVKMENFANMGLLVNEIFTAPFNQPSEFEADIVGLNLMNKAGYNPKMALDFFSRLGRYENKTLLEKFFRTHPYSSERKSCLEYNITNL